MRYGNTIITVSGLPEKPELKIPTLSDIYPGLDDLVYSLTGHAAPPNCPYMEKGYYKIATFGRYDSNTKNWYDDNDKLIGRVERNTVNIIGIDFECDILIKSPDGIDKIYGQRNAFVYVDGTYVALRPNGNDWEATRLINLKDALGNIDRKSLISFLNYIYGIEKEKILSVD